MALASSTHALVLPDACPVFPHLSGGGQWLRESDFPGKDRALCAAIEQCGSDWDARQGIAKLMSKPGTAEGWRVSSSLP